MFMEQRLATLEEELAKLRESLSSEKLASLEDRLGWLDQQHQELAERAGRLEGRPGAEIPDDVGTRIEAVESRLEQALATHAGTEQQAQNNQQWLSAIEHQQNELRGAAEQLAARVDRLSESGSKERLASLEVRLAGLDGARSDLVQRLSEEQRLRAAVEERLQALEISTHATAEQLGQLHGSGEHYRGRLEQVENGLAGLPLGDWSKRLEGTEQTVGGYHGWLTNIASAQDQLRDRADRVEAVLANWQSQNVFARLEHTEQELAGWRALNVPQTLQSAGSEIRGLRHTSDQLVQQVGELRAQNAARLIEQLSNRLNELEQRCLELENRSEGHSDTPRPWAWLGPALGLSALVIALMGLYRTPEATRDPVLSGERLVLKSRGRVLAEMGPGAEGAGLVLYDNAGHKRIGLQIASAGPSLALWDPKDVQRLALASHQQGPYLVFQDQSQKQRMRLGAGAAGNGLSLLDAQEVVRVGLGLAEEGVALNFFDSNQNERVMLSDSRTGPTLALLDPGRKTRATLGVTAEGCSILNLHDAEGRQRAVLDVAAEGAYLKLLDPNGQVIHFLPK